MSDVVLDTSAYSYFRVGRESVLARLERAGIIYVPAIVIGELHAGFAGSRRRRENEVALSEFLAEPFVRTVAVDGDVARHYAQFFAAVRRRGDTASANDLWIAACAAHVDAELVSFDKDFRRIPGLRLALLTV